MNAEEQVKALFQKVLDEHAGNKAAAAASLDTNHVTFWGWMKGKRGLNKALLKAIDMAGGQIVLPGQPATIQRMGANSPKIVVSDGGKLIDVYHVAGAGQAWELIELEPLKSISIPVSFATQISFAVLVRGDSMYPTLKSGSVVGVRRGDPFDNSEIYAVSPPDGGLSVKRVIRDYQREGFILRSDNPNKDSYVDVFIPNAMAENLIVGRVVWVWQGV